jgi:4-hydroxythreonine-4-phosphate dehydrogenase
VAENKPIAVTLGDPAGIGPEVLRAALNSSELVRTVPFEVIGESSTAPGTPTEAGTRAAFRAMESAADGLRTGLYSAVVTGPIHKAKMREVGFMYPGQTEFFAQSLNTTNFAMCLTGGNLTVALVTAHEPLSRVPLLLCTPEITRVGRLLEAFLRVRLGRAPRIAVAGLNPHAGESGLLGNEEQDVISPAIEMLNRESITKGITRMYSGPWSPDTVFHRALLGDFDGVLCMYHDQGLIPLKLHAFDSGVNVTLGLPFPRTSPDHGTAFEIAGKGVASPNSMIAAMNLASEMVQSKARAQTA